MSAYTTAMIAILCGLTAPVTAHAQALNALPFGVGEQLSYRVRMGRFGDTGHGTMRVDEGGLVQGRATLLLSFSFGARVGLFKVSNQMRSWIDPLDMSALRFSVKERSPLSGREDTVDIFAEAHRWASAQTSGVTDVDCPLDELSFIYYIRTLPLENGAQYTVSRHFDAGRNPVTIKVVARERVSIPDGDYETVVVDMHVNDAGHFKGNGSIRFFFTDDALHVPVRIESSMPIAGRLVFTLTARNIATTRASTSAAAAASTAR